ncbi:MAG: flagellar biosynthetic protein FliR [Burkholderiales bacterium]|nr:flagellar biosynthetic protein FliR [Burkholderiales bacterium]
MLDYLAPAYWLPYFFYFLRCVFFLGLTPLFSVFRVPVLARVVFSAGVALAIAQTGPAVVALPEQNVMGWIVWGATREMLLGALMAAGVTIALSALQLGGRLVDFQIGFGFAHLIDPNTRAATPLVGYMLYLAGVLVFLFSGGDYVLLKALALSTQAYPPGFESWAEIPMGQIVLLAGAMFSFALALIAPIMLFLLLLDVGFAIMSRALPSANVFFIQLPIKAFVGLVALAVYVPFMQNPLQRLFEEIYTFWAAVLSV